MDWDKNGTISCVEFKSYLQRMSGGDDILNHEDVVTAFKQIDVDGSKAINWEEFYVSTVDVIYSLIFSFFEKNVGLSGK